MVEPESVSMVQPEQRAEVLFCGNGYCERNRPAKCAPFAHPAQLA